MFQRERVIAALEAKAHRFAGYEAILSDALLAYDQGFNQLEKMSRAEIEARLGSSPWPGARPTVEQDEHGGIVIPFDQTWANHEQARTWAKGILSGVPTIAVDGSQITPSKEISVPVGAVQIGWFLNPHDADQPYVKDIYFEVLAPDELAGEDEEIVGFFDWMVNFRRFALECKQLGEMMEAAQDRLIKPICFFDGSLIISFIQHLLPERQRLYLDAMVDLLRASEEYQVPLVGYIDTSYASDLAAMLDALADRHPRQRISDGALLRPRMDWGDRTVAFICARDDKVTLTDNSKYYDQVCFVYLKTTADRPPARLDLPLWMLDDGILEQTIDVVRAECVVGNGYPYAVETADAVGVITMQDRERFYGLFQAFAQQVGLPVRFSRKAVSKRGRRS
jgi:hypothetical protein